jgi:beta-galactosidase/beta-glucuronidase
VDIVVSEQDSNKILLSAKGASNNPFTFKVDSPDLWTPDTPTLYNIEVTLGEDSINSYTGFRLTTK